MLITPDWIAVDWGTSNLRAWAMSADGSVLAEASSDKGMLRVETGGFEEALLALVSDWLPSGETKTVLAAGMVGARQGWIEAPYAEVPCAGIDPGTMAQAPVEDPRLSVHILPGLCQREPADVMRGEETQIFGFLAEQTGFTGSICLPGTHSKWVEVSGGRVSGFHTAMTGELFELLSKQSVLKHSMDTEWSEAAFLDGVAVGLEAPGDLISSLFAIRAESLLRDPETGWGAARLSGLLIGAELASSVNTETSVALIGGGRMVDLYAAALSIRGIEALRFDAGRATRAGLTAAYQSLSGASA